MFTIFYDLDLTKDNPSQKKRLVDVKKRLNVGNFFCLYSFLVYLPSHYEKKYHPKGYRTLHETWFQECDYG